MFGFCLPDEAGLHGVQFFGVEGTNSQQGCMVLSFSVQRELTASRHAWNPNDPRTWNIEHDSGIYMAGMDCWEPYSGCVNVLASITRSLRAKKLLKRFLTKLWVFTFSVFPVERRRAIH